MLQETAQRASFFRGVVNAPRTWAGVRRSRSLKAPHFQRGERSLRVSTLSKFGELLKSFRTKAGLKQQDVAKKAGLDRSILSRWESGDTQPRNRQSVLAVAMALNLDPYQTDQLLEAVGCQPESVLDIPGLNFRDPSLRALFREVAAVRDIDKPEWSAALEEAMRLMLAGARQFQTGAITGLIPKPILKTVPLTDEEKHIDDVLTSVLSRQVAPDATWQLLSALESGSLQWELRRRLAKALPILVEHDVEGTFRMVDILRMDYISERFHDDLRRRVIESLPILYPYDNERVLALLEPQPKDQIYTHIAIVEALHDIPQIPQEDIHRIQLALREHEYTEHVGVVEFLSGLLGLIRVGNTAEALAIMHNARDQDRIFRTCIMRTLPRLFDADAISALWLMNHFFRRAEGEYAEHINVRRPAVRALPKMISLLGSSIGEAILARIMIQQLAQDRDVIIRREVADKLPRLAMSHRDFGDQLADAFVVDSDVYIRRRAWSAKARATGGSGD